MAADITLTTELAGADKTEQTLDRLQTKADRLLATMEEVLRIAGEVELPN